MYDAENVEFKFSRLRRHLEFKNASQVHEWQFANSLFKVIHFSIQMSSQSSTWKMTTQTKLEITLKLVAQFQFCKKYLIFG